MDFESAIGFMVFGAYTWPFLVALVHVWARSRLSRFVLSSAEAFAGVGSGWLIYGLGTLGRMLIGGYLALVALSVYLAATLAEIWGIVAPGKGR